MRTTVYYIDLYQLAVARSVIVYIGKIEIDHNRLQYTTQAWLVDCSQVYVYYTYDNDDDDDDDDDDDMLMTIEIWLAMQK